MTPPFFRERRLEEADAAYQAFLAGGFPCVLGGNIETLQLRDDADKTNWLIFLGVCNEAVTGLLGSSTIPLPIRCTSNRTYFITYLQAQTLVRDMRAWGFAAQANAWLHKDALAMATTGEELNAVDVKAGWP